MVPPYPVYLFDVDGTLMDSAADICGAIRELLEKQETFVANGPTDVSFDFLRGYIGKHLFDLFQDLGFPETRMDLLIADYREIYLGRSHSATTVFPGVAEMLSQLGGRKATATTKGTPTTGAILTQFGLRAYFDHVQGTDGFPAKPAPDVLLMAMSALQAKPEECLLVGDSAADMEAARRAGIHCCGVRWGYGDPVKMAAWEPDYWIESPHELL